MIGLFCLLLAACGGKKKYNIDFPQTTVLKAAETWGVIDRPLIRIYARPGDKSEPVSSIWRGCVVRVIARTVDPVPTSEGSDYWYQVEYEGYRGWLSSRILLLYEFEKDALKKAEEYR